MLTFIKMPPHMGITYPSSTIYGIRHYHSTIVLSLQDEPVPKLYFEFENLTNEWTLISNIEYIDIVINSFFTLKSKTSEMS